MVAWHVTPDYIVNNWTDELFALMCDKFAERIKRQTEAHSGEVSVDTLAAKSRGMIEVKRGN